ncbi:MAG: winged helix-turn-helix transcriptional regulator [Alphaproteobacteria bacterium]|nr:winged helix-turn-helix transcriptional regulator [Alphaproteobacteria bacterium]
MSAAPDPDRFVREHGKRRSYTRSGPKANGAEQQGEAPALRVVTATQLMALDIPPRELLLAPWLSAQGLALLYARRGVGKTHLGMGIAYAVASGGSFLRWRAPRPRRVLYIDGEMPARVLQERLAAIVKGQPSEAQEPPDDYLRFITPDLQKGPIPNVATAEGQAALDPVLKNTDLAIVDNLSCLAHYGIENEAESWTPIQSWALRLRHQSTSVLFLHHAGKGGDQRGTSRREDVLDTVVRLSRPSDYQANEGARFEVHFEKARGLYGPDALPFEAKLEVHDGAAVWTMRSLDEMAAEQVADLLRQGMKQREAAAELGMSKSAVNRHARRAREAGLL